MRSLARALTGLLFCAAIPTGSAAAETSSTALGPSDLERLATRLRSDDVDARRAAVRSLLDAEQASAPALRARLFREYGPSPARLFNALQRANRQGERRRGPGGGDGPRHGEDEVPGDLLEDLVVVDRAGESADREAIDASLEIVALLRALAATRSVEATLSLIDFSLRERGTFQREIGRILSGMGAPAVPGLLRSRQHEHRPTRVWCARILEDLGFESPALAVQQTDNALLAQILLAYAEVKDSDAMRVIVSFTGSERPAVREAARQGVTHYGQNALWGLRHAFENHTGEEPPTAWGWERTARELYARYDRARLAEPTRLLEEGLRAAQKGDTRAMRAAFEKALTQAPALDRRSEMVAPLLAHADDLLDDGEEQEVLHVCRLALRLDPEGPQARPLQARIAYLEGRRALAAGVPDERTFAEAARLDPDFDPAADALAAIRAERRRGGVRVLQAVLAGASALLGIAALGAWTWQKRRRAARPAETA